MISYDHFGKLRLAHFLPGDQITKLRDWEFEENLWVGEAIGFSEWLRLEKEPDVLRSLAIDFAKFTNTTVEEVLRTIDLPIRGGMTFEDLRMVLGEPDKILRFVADRTTYEFLSQEPHPYKVSCTVLNKGGLVYLVVTVLLQESSVRYINKR
jgi:hypothetical protein